ncbi:MAG: F0F1 ATP synthase subunit gamma [Acidobacteria bacterium]|nr:F0F1 ATP synthase subunit gamma [Acidobacteriota bacterium]
MSETTAGLRHKMASAGQLQAVVRTMKALAASNIGQYEASVRALADYFRTVELGLIACLHNPLSAREPVDGNGPPGPPGTIGAVVFGSDQGLVGQFNDVLADHAVARLAALPGTVRVWAVGERVQARLSDAGLSLAGLFAVPNSVRGITPLVGQILLESESGRADSEVAELHLFYNRPTSGSLYAPIGQRLLPLDDEWRDGLARQSWPARCRPDLLGGDTATLRAFIREYLFVSLFRACAESLASENASRLAAMQRASKNIDDLLEQLSGRYNAMRKSGIDEELFDVLAGFEALPNGTPRRD